MTARTKQTTKENEIDSSGLVESASVNSITDFTSLNLKESMVKPEKKSEDFTNIFICHLIFYLIFCFSLVLHILIDLGLGSFIKSGYNQIKGNRKKAVFEKVPAFA